MTWRLLSTLTPHDLKSDNGDNGKVLVWGRVLLQPYGNRLAFKPYWTRWAVWKVIWMSHRGLPTNAGTLEPSYMPMDGCPTDMQATHWQPTPLGPPGAPVGDEEYVRGQP